jgi:chemotaxis protein MotA
MDIATLIGIVAGIGIIAGAMSMGSSLTAFFNVPGLMIVVGGTFAATLINESLGQVLGAVKVCMQAFFERKRSRIRAIERVVQLAAKAVSSPSRERTSMIRFWLAASAWGWTG